MKPRLDSDVPPVRPVGEAQDLRIPDGALLLARRGLQGGLLAVRAAGKETPNASAPEAGETSPFIYQRTEDPSLADFTYQRQTGTSKIRTVGSSGRRLTDREILEDVQRKSEAPYWFLSPYWREKGLPHEQVELSVDGRTINVINFNAATPLTDEHLAEMGDAVGRMAASFPQIVEKCRWILLDDVQPVSELGDDSKYPQNGEGLLGQQAIVINPKGMEPRPHRVAAASNLAGTTVHEMIHLGEDEFVEEWKQHFGWRMARQEEGWELRVPPTGEGMKWFNVETGEMLPQGFFPLQPEACVTDYGKSLLREDICDSAVAYFFDRLLLESKSSVKAAILTGHDSRRGRADVAARRVPAVEIALPQPEPKTVYYYVQES